MTQYSRGRKIEYRVVKMLRELGADVVRSSGSHGLWDVAGLFPDGSIWLIAVKYTAAKTGKPWVDDNWRQLEAAKLQPGVHASGLVWRKGKSFPEYYELGQPTEPNPRIDGPPPWNWAPPTTGSHTLALRSPRG